MAKRPTGPALLSSSALAQPHGAVGWHGLRAGDAQGTCRGRAGDAQGSAAHPGLTEALPGGRTGGTAPASPCPGAGSKPAAPRGDRQDLEAGRGRRLRRSWTNHS